MSRIHVHVRDLGVIDSSRRLRPPKPSSSSSSAAHQESPPRSEPPSFIHFDKRHVEEAKSSEWVKANEERRNAAAHVEQLQKLKEEAERRRRIGAVVPGPIARPFQYTALRDSSNQVRLLQLDIVSGQVVCIQQVFPLAAAPPYVAVSYTWGSPADKSIVWINRDMLIVPASCGTALQELASQGVKHWVWIDAICIHQADAHEKAHQVHMMTRIFSGAVWVAAIPSEPLLVQALTHDLASLDKLLQWLSEDSFWTRIWIVQEFLVAKEVRLLGGGSSLLDVELRQMLCSARTRSDLAGSRMSRLVQDRYHISGFAPPASLVLHCLSKYSNLECTDPRDRIFALVPMALRDSGMALLQPNYEQSVFETLLDFAEYVCDLDRKRDGQGSSASDLLISLMKVTQALQLDLQSDEVRSFLTSQRQHGARDEEKDQKIGCWTSHQVKTLCLNRADLSLRKWSDLRHGDMLQFKSMGLDSTSHDFDVVYLGNQPAYAVSGDILSGDILLSPTIGSMMTTWNLIFRQSGTSQYHYDFVGQAILLKGSSRTFSNKCACTAGTCPTHRQAQILKLQAHDAVALALQARTPGARLLDAEKYPSRGTHAIFI